MSNQTMRSKERREYAPRSRRASVLPNLDLWPVTSYRPSKIQYLNERVAKGKDLYGSRFCAHILDGSDSGPFTYNQRAPYSLKPKSGRVSSEPIQFSLTSMSLRSKGGFVEYLAL